MLERKRRRLTQERLVKAINHADQRKSKLWRQIALNLRFQRLGWLRAWSQEVALLKMSDSRSKVIAPGIVHGETF